MPGAFQGAGIVCRCQETTRLLGCSSRPMATSAVGGGHPRDSGTPAGQAQQPGQAGYRRGFRDGGWKRHTPGMEANADRVTRSSIWLSRPRVAGRMAVRGRVTPRLRRPAAVPAAPVHVAPRVGRKGSAPSRSRGASNSCGVPGARHGRRSRRGGLSVRDALPPEWNSPGRLSGGGVAGVRRRRADEPGRARVRATRGVVPGLPGAGCGSGWCRRR